MLGAQKQEPLSRERLFKQKKAPVRMILTGAFG
jgi:hypothetical protein